MQQQLKDLKVWKKGIDLVKSIYLLTKRIPSEEIYGIISQMRRAAVSIPANIAEGKGRFHKKELVQFLYTARGSAYELITLIEISKELSYIDKDQAATLEDECSQIIAMLNGLIQAIKQ